MYLTPERFRTMGLGVDLTDVDDIELQSMLARASATVDDYCNVPVLPNPFDFRGGTMTDEAHEWSDSLYDRPRPYRFWPMVASVVPVLSVEQFRVYSTPNVYVEIDETEMFINNTGGWIEVSSLKLTQFGIFGAGIVPALIGMYHPVAKCTYTYGWTFASVDEVMYPVDAQRYQAQSQWWYDDPAPVVEVNGAAAGTHTIDYDEGTVTFASALSATDVVTVSYSYKLPWQISHATGIIAADDFGEKKMRSRGMTGLDSIQVGEITLRRAAAPGQRGGTATIDPVSDKAAGLLSRFIFTAVR